MKVMSTITKQQEAFLTTKLAQRIINLEYQLGNKDFMAAKEIATAESDYQLDVKTMRHRFILKGKEMSYPAIQDWPDSEPMSRVNEQTGGILASTDMYQETISLMMLGAISEEQ